MTDHVETRKFTPGAKVIVQSGSFGSRKSYHVDEVLKAHKSGRFTLKREPSQQWRPYLPCFRTDLLTAEETGSYPRWGGRRNCYLWDAESDHWARKVLAGEKHVQRFNAAVRAVSELKLSETTPEMLNAIETALAMRKKDEPK